ncbi:hypothetical protein GcC1_012023 [Golovinomyces cichoracearum]|uniref:Uncharacterized protein n=1 Tax=Golovinomyces cichoracearum TaxID=62708 RepID=A0A420J7E5_9PEZI|nr:hypothetical protein GcC1_012023 [Golovinomyces cichoracearum]
MSNITSPVLSTVKTVQRAGLSRTVGRPKNFHRHSSSFLSCPLRDARTVASSCNPIDRLQAYKPLGSNDTHSLHIIHRPRPSPKSYRFMPLMQGFQTTSPKNSFHRLSTIDSHSLPSLKYISHVSDKVRVPLLPDNYSPNRSPNSGIELETLDDAPSKSEHFILAYHPENVTSATRCEIFGNSSDTLLEKS